jgi:hypothetical protein
MLGEHPTEGPGIYENRDATSPFAGDYILEFISGRIICRFWYVIDREKMVVSVVAAWSQPFAIM